MINDKEIICPQCASVVDTDQVRGLLESNARLEKDWAYFSELCTKQQAEIETIRALVVELGRERAQWLADRRAINAVQEVYAGMEGFKPETAPEGYCLRIIEQMYRASVGDE